MLAQGLLAAAPSETIHSPVPSSPAAVGPDVWVDPTGSGTLGTPRTVQIVGRGDADGAGERAKHQLLWLEDRGVRGAMLCWEGGEQPLAFANIERAAATLIVTVNAAVHPSFCARNNNLTVAHACATPAEATALQAEIDAALETVNRTPWGVSKSFVREQSERWETEWQRCQGMTVAQYFADIGLAHVYDKTWDWCAGVLEALEAQEEKSPNDLREIEYYRRKVERTEMYEDMELTDYMNVLKHQDLAGPRRDGEAEHLEKKVSYADSIAADSTGNGWRKVGRATVFVSHVWKMATREFFEACLAEMAEEDYAWIDLYLHNQYQGAVSSIGDENSTYWINKFGELIRSIGKVIAIVTDWESPVLLSRIWCLFELNAAIEMGAELRFVASAKERQDLSLNLNNKFQQLEGVVRAIEVRNCSAKRPHEIEDKRIFLAKLRGIEDEVNTRLQRELRRWLCEAAESVIERTDPQRPALDEAGMALEVAQTGDCWWTQLSVERDPFCGCAPRISISGGGARLTALLERLPRLPQLMILLGMLAQVAFIASLGVWWLEGAGSSWLWLALALAFGMFLFTPIGLELRDYQRKRQLRRPTLLGEWATRYNKEIARTALQLVAWVALFAVATLLMGNKLWFDVGWQPALIGLVVVFLVVVAFRVEGQEAKHATADRAMLRTRAGWLRMRMGDAERAVARLQEAHDELLNVIGPEELDSWLVVAALVRALCEVGRVREATAVRSQLEQVARKKLLSSAGGVATGYTIGYWGLLRADVAAAARAPDSEVLALLEVAAKCNCWVPAGSRSVMSVTSGATEGWLPEWEEFLGRMAPPIPGSNGDEVVVAVAVGPSRSVSVLHEASVVGGEATEGGGEATEAWQTYRDVAVRLARVRVAKLTNDSVNLKGEFLDEALESRGLPKYVGGGEDDLAKQLRLALSIRGVNLGNRTKPDLPLWAVSRL
eukprot:COSAG02_NODE_6144_length_3769_cov_2.667302_1_plen_949_part_01